MKKISKLLSFALFFVLGTFLFSMTASAYIDPSAMTYIVQVVVGIVVVGGAAFGFYFKKLKRKLKKKTGTQEDYDSRATLDNNVTEDDFDDFDENK